MTRQREIGYLAEPRRLLDAGDHVAAVELAFAAFNRIAAGNPEAAGILSAFIDEGMAEIDAAHPPPALPDGSLDWEAMTGETIDSLF